MLSMLQYCSARHTVCAKVLIVLCISVLNCHFVVKVGSNVVVIFSPSMDILVIVIFSKINA